jgi:uncharacterized protein YutE (UPF0331/DUF86 family)
MNDPKRQMEKVARLERITQRLGFALWQLQELEGATAAYFVLVVHASKCIGVEAGRKLEASVSGRTFGTTLKKLREAGKMPSELEARFQSLLRERNWLIHSSRDTDRRAVLDDSACQSLLTRVDAIAEEASLLLRELAACADTYVLTQGIADHVVEELTRQVLETWHTENAA